MKSFSTKSFLILQTLFGLIGVEALQMSAKARKAHLESLLSLGNKSKKNLKSRNLSSRSSRFNENLDKVSTTHTQRYSLLERLGVKHKAVSSYEASSSTQSKSKSKSKMAIVHKTAYWGQVRVGGQSFNVIFDTGSGNMIIPSSACTGPGCDSHKKYNVNLVSDSTSTDTEKKVVTNDHGESEAEISFGTGDIAGKFYNDKLCLGEGGQICVNVNFIGATQQSAEPFAATPFDGIMGLGFKDLSMGNNFNIIDDLVGNGALPNGMFSFALADEGPSSITFGGYRPEAVVGDIVWSDVTLPSYWQIRSDDIMLNGEQTGLCGPQGCQVAVDTGTSMLAGPSSLIEQLTNRVPVKEDCSNYHDLPVLGFKIGNKVLNLRPDEYVDNDRNQACSFSLMSLDVPPPKGPLFIFGDPFLRRFVTVFDRENSRVGFGVSAKGGSENENAITDYDEGSRVFNNNKSARNTVDLAATGGLSESERNSDRTSEESIESSFGNFGLGRNFDNNDNSESKRYSSFDSSSSDSSSTATADSIVSALDHMPRRTTTSKGVFVEKTRSFNDAVDVSLQAGMMEGEEQNQDTDLSSSSTGYYSSPNSMSSSNSLSGTHSLPSSLSDRFSGSSSSSGFGNSSFASQYDILKHSRGEGLGLTQETVKETAREAHARRLHSMHEFAQKFNEDRARTRSDRATAPSAIKSRNGRIGRNPEDDPVLLQTSSKLYKTMTNSKSNTKSKANTKKSKSKTKLSSQTETKTLAKATPDNLVTVELHKMDAGSFFL